jgi:hypothetical protein
MGVTIIRIVAAEMIGRARAALDNYSSLSGGVMETEKVCKPGHDCASRLHRQNDETSSVTPLSAALT